MSIRRIAFAGAGRVAAHLAVAFRKAGHEVSILFNRTSDAPLEAGGFVFERTTNIDRLTRGCPDLILVAVGDDAVAGVAAGTTDPTVPIAHTSGALPTTVLENGQRACGVFYPLQTFTADRTPEWPGIPICVTADNADFKSDLLELAGTITKRPVPLRDDQRPWLHLSAVLVNNCVNHLLARSRDLMLHRDLPVDLLTPLLEETVRKAVAADHPADIQTGPARRGDMATLEIHRRLLQEFGDERLVDLYDYFWRSIESYEHDLSGESSQR